MKSYTYVILEHSLSKSAVIFQFYSFRLGLKNNLNLV